MAGKLRYRPPTTAAEKQQRDQTRAAQLEQLHAQLADSVRALRTGDDWQRLLTTASHLTGYSFRNLVAIYAQRPQATQVAGYKAWQTLNRQVHKGEKGIRILAPVTKKLNSDNPDGASADQDDSASDAQKSPRTVVGYHVVHVWDISQTTGDPLPLPPTMALITGQAPPGLWEGLADLTTKQGFILERAALPGRTNGETNFTTKTVTVRPDIDDAHAVKTLAHELGHILLQHEELLSNGCRGLLEVEAESVAYLITASRGLATDDYSFGYVANWATAVAGKQPEEVVTETGQKVMGTAATIIEHLEVTAQDPAITELASRAEQAARSTAALARRADAAKTHADHRREDSPPPHRPDLVAIHEAALAFYKDNLTHHTAPTAYLQRRGISDATTTDWALGYATPGWTDLVDRLRGHGFTEQTIEESGLGLRSRDGKLIDRFRDRIMFPLRNENAHVVGFIGRTLATNPNMAKYLNSPETPIYSKTTVLYGLPEQSQQLAAGATPVLVEGPLDVLAISETTSNTVGVSPCGTALTASHVSALRGAIADTSPVIVAFDADTAGRQATSRAYDLLQAHPGPCRTVTWPNGDDPASYRHDNGTATLQHHLQNAQRPLVEVVIDEHLHRWQRGLDHPETRVAAARAIAPMLIASPGTEIAPRAAYLAQKTHLDYETVNTILIAAVEHQTSSGQRIRARGQPDEATAAPSPAALAHQGFDAPLTLTGAAGSATAAPGRKTTNPLEQVTHSL